MTLEKVLLVKPRGFCAGVVRAVDIVEEALKVTRPIYVRKEIVHNKSHRTVAPRCRLWSML